MKKLVVVLVLLGMVTGMAQAGIEAGRAEIQIQGSISNQGSDREGAKDSQSLNGSLSLNYFVGANMSVGVTAMLMGNKFEDTTYSTVFALGRLDFYLGSGESTVVPYVGGRGGMALSRMDSKDASGRSTSESDNTITYGGQAGLKIFASENTSWNIEASYTIWAPEVEAGQEEVNYNEATVSVGFSYYF